jgi:hypothetical protein
VSGGDPDFAGSTFRIEAAPAHLIEGARNYAVVYPVAEQDNGSSVFEMLHMSEMGFGSDCRSTISEARRGDALRSSRKPVWRGWLKADQDLRIFAGDVIVERRLDRAPDFALDDVETGELARPSIVVGSVGTTTSSLIDKCSQAPFKDRW